MRHRILRMRLDETREALSDLWRQLRCDAINFAKEIVRPWIRRIEIDRAAERRDGIAVLSARVLRNSEADLQSWRCRESRNTCGEHFQGVISGAQPQVDVSPIEQVLLGRVHVGRALEMVGRLLQVSREL